MSRISNIIFRNNPSNNNNLSISSNKPDHNILSSVYNEEKEKITHSSLINANQSLNHSQHKKKSLSISSYSEVIPRYNPITLEENSRVSQIIIRPKRYDYGNTPIQSYHDVLLSNSSSSFCYAKEPRGGVVYLSSSPNQTIPINTASALKIRKKNRSLTEMKGKKVDYSTNAYKGNRDHHSSFNKPKPIRDKMKEMWLNEVSISTADSFDIESISNELVLPKKDWLYLEVIDNEISFHCKTVHAIHEQIEKLRRDNSHFSIFSTFIKKEEAKMNLNLEIDSFHNEIKGIDEEAHEIKLIKNKTILKSNKSQQLKNGYKYIRNDDDSDNDNDDYINHFNINILNPSHKELWNERNEINKNQQLEININPDSNTNIGNDNDNDSNSNEKDKYYFIHQRKNEIIRKIKISSFQMPTDSSICNLFKPKSYMIDSLKPFSLLSSSICKELIVQSQIRSNSQFLSPHYSKCDSFTLYSIFPTKKWDPVTMRKENQERIDYIIEKSILLRTDGNRHIKEVYKIEYDEMVEEEEISTKKLKSKPKPKEKEKVEADLMQCSILHETIHGTPLIIKWNNRNTHQAIVQFTLKNKNKLNKWNNKSLYPIQSNFVSFINLSEKDTTNAKQININQSNGQELDHIIIDNQNFTFDSDQRSLNHNRIQSYRIMQYDIAYETNPVDVQLKKSKTFKIKTNEFINYLTEERECFKDQIDEKELLSIMLNRWNTVNDLNQAINYNLIHQPVSSLFQYENNDLIEIVQRGKAMKRNIMIPYQAINFHLDGLTLSYDYSPENQMEFMLKNKQDYKNNIEVLTISEPILIEYRTIKKKRKAKMKKAQITDNQANEPNHNQLKRDNEVDSITNAVPYSNENKQKIEEDDINNLDKHNQGDSLNIVINENIEDDDKKIRDNQKNKDKVLKSKKHPMPLEKNKSLPVNNNKKNNEFFSGLSPNKNYNNTTITKTKEKKKHMPMLIKPAVHDFTIYTKDQGIQRVKTNIIK